MTLRPVCRLLIHHFLSERDLDFDTPPRINPESDHTASGVECHHRAALRLNAVDIAIRSLTLFAVKEGVTTCRLSPIVVLAAGSAEDSNRAAASAPDYRAVIVDVTDAREARRRRSTRQHAEDRM